MLVCVIREHLQTSNKIYVHHVMLTYNWLCYDFVTQDLQHEVFTPVSLKALSNCTK